MVLPKRRPNQAVSLRGPAAACCMLFIAWTGAGWFLAGRSGHAWGEVQHSRQTPAETVSRLAVHCLPYSLPLTVRPLATPVHRCAGHTRRQTSLSGRGCAGARQAGDGAAAAEAPPPRRRWRRVAVQSAQMAAIWGGFLGLQIGKTRFPRCSGAYGGLFAVQIVLSIATSAFFTWQAHHQRKLKLQTASRLRQPMLADVYAKEPVWTLRRLMRATFIALIGGFVAGAPAARAPRAGMGSGESCSGRAAEDVAWVLGAVQVLCGLPLHGLTSGRALFKSIWPRDCKDASVARKAAQSRGRRAERRARGAQACSASAAA